MLGELAEQQGAEPTPLILVRNGEGDLGTLGVDPSVRGVPDNALAWAGRGDQSERFNVVDVAVALSAPGEVDACREESQGAGVRRERGQELQQPPFVFGPDRPDVNRRAVSQRDVSFTMGRIGGAHDRPIPPR